MVGLCLFGRGELSHQESLYVYIYIYARMVDVYIYLLLIPGITMPTEGSCPCAREWNNLREHTPRLDSAPRLENGCVLDRG